jgi:outer membrane lipopolysaccharide assembly protein LptE/RlpB
MIKVSLLIILFSSCGYHLRNSNLGEQYQSVDLAIGARSLLKRPLVGELLASGVKLSEDSDVNLIIKKDRLVKIVQSVGVNNQVQEYRLEYDVQYIIGDSEPQEVHVERDYSFDVQEIGGGQTEERTLREQLAQDMARAIIRQLLSTVK